MYVVRRVLGSELLNKPLATAFIPPLFLALVAGWYLPWILQRHNVRTEALKQRGQLEMQAFQELHALSKDFLRVRLAYDAQATRCPSEEPPRVCVAEALVKLQNFSSRWDEKANYYAVVLTSYLEHPEDSPVMRHLQAVREVVDRTIDCVYPNGATEPNIKTCRVTQQDVDFLDAHLSCFSRVLLTNARSHTEGFKTSGEADPCP